jgi:hypothetical protein
MDSGLFLKSQFAATLFAVVLISAAIAVMLSLGTVKRGARNYLALAAAFYSALGVAQVVASVAVPHQEIVRAVALVVLAPGAVALALAFSSALGRVPGDVAAALALVAAIGTSFFSAVSGTEGGAYAALLTAAGVMSALGFRQKDRTRTALRPMLTALCLAAGAACLLIEAGQGATMLFWAAGLVGTAQLCMRCSSRFVDDEPLGTLCFHVDLDSATAGCPVCESLA